MEIERLEKRNHYEEIAEQIRGMITGGKLKVGDKLPSTKEMAERFGVGRSTMREALSALKAVGLIEIRQGGVCRVLREQPMSEAVGALDALQLQGSTLLELLEARQSLESSNAAIAARKRTEADIESLRSIVNQMQQAAGDDAEGERLDLAFHQGLALATHNSIIVQLFETIMLQTANAIRDVRRVEIYANQDIAQQLYREHSAILDAVIQGQPQQASEAMQVHLQHVENIVHKHVR